MFSSVECRAKAKEKANLASHSARRKHLLSAARAWHLLADKVEAIEAEIAIARESAENSAHAVIQERVA
jgi:hypothetical protein